MSKSILDIDLKLNQINEAARGVNEISNEWKQRFLSKLEQIKLRVENIQLLPPVKEIRNHPLLNDVILKEIMSYLDNSCNESISTLLNIRQVCKKWKECATPVLLKRVNLHIPPVEYFGWDWAQQSKNKGIPHLDSLMNQGPKIWSFDVNRQIDKGDSAENEKDFWNNRIHWIQKYGYKLTQLSLTNINIEERIILSLLKDFTPSLEILNLSNVTMRSGSSSFSSKKSLKYLLGNLRHLAIENTFIDTEDLEIAAKTGLKILQQAKNLKSFSLTSSCLQQELFGYFFTCIISVDKEIFINLEKLLLNDLKPSTIPLLNQLAFTNLKELTIFTFGKRCCGSWLQTVGPNLEKLHIYVNIVHFNNDEVIFIPKMSKLKVFTYSFAKVHHSIPSIHCTIPTAYTAATVIRFMPVLKMLSFKECGDLGGAIDDNFCIEGKCTHAEEIFHYTDGDAFLPVHAEVEKLEISCCFQNPGLVHIVTCAFINLQCFSFWLDSEHLNNVFAHLSKLDHLKLLTIHLSQSIKDFPRAVKGNIPNFKSLNELVLVKASSPFFKKTACVITNVHLAHTGFAKCNALKILTFWNIQVDYIKFQRLRKDLLKSKPKLAINQI